MILIISPSKTQDLKSRQYSRFTVPVMLEQSQQLIDALKGLNPEQIAGLMGVSDKLAQLNWQRFQDLTVPFDLENAKQALLVFKGDVFSPIDVEAYTDEDFSFAQDHVRILSGLYGILRPLDLMQAYRLEMGIKSGFANAKNLYEFWGTRLTEALNKDLAQQSQAVLVNLASDEYYKVIQPQKITAPVLKVSFKENKSGTYKVVAIHAKRARGLMINFVVTNHLEKVQDLKTFNLQGYQFNDSLSSDQEWVFCRN
jgi:cytoplasmic iron level regulating protein YaaA (DUF328/UPF0246 family)